MLKLIYPTPEYFDSIMEMRSELLEKDNSYYIHGSGNLQDYTNVKEWMCYIEKLRHKETCPKNLVDSDIYLVIREEDNYLIGIAELRHHINDPVLGTWGGHIGYTVRPSERKKGYARIILRLLLDESKKLGIHEVLLTCNENNEASERKILSGGGFYEKTVLAEQLNMKMKRFWIKIDNNPED